MAGSFGQPTLSDLKSFFSNLLDKTDEKALGAQDGSSGYGAGQMANGWVGMRRAAGALPEEAGPPRSAMMPDMPPQPMPPPPGQPPAGTGDFMRGVGGAPSEFSAVPPTAFDSPPSLPSGGGGGAPPLGPMLPPQKAPSKGLAAMGAKMPVTSGQAKLAPLGEDEYQALAQSVQNAGLDSITQQRAGIDDLVKKRDEIAANPYGVDLSPLLALGDAWNPGAHTAQGYAKPETPEERRNTLLAMEEKLQGMRGAVSKDDIELLKSRLQDQGHRQETMQRSQDRETQMQMHRDEMNARLQEANLRFAEMRDQKNQNALLTQIDHFNKDPNVVKSREKLDEVKNAADLLRDARTMPGQAQPARTAIARMFANRLSDQEMKQFTGDQTLENKLDRMFTTAKGGTITDADYNALMNVVSTIHKNAADSIDQHATMHANQYAQVTGGDPAHAKYVFTGGMTEPSAPGGGGAAGDLASGAQAELERRAKAKAQAGR